MFLYRLLLVALAAAPALLIAQSPPLSLVSTAWTPFTNDVGHPRFALNLAEAALGRIGANSKTTIVSATDFTTALLEGRFDGSAAAWKDAQREQALVFSQPYLENRLVLVGRRGADVSAKTLPVLAGRRIALVGGYAYGDAIELARAGLRPVTQRGRQPHAPAERHGRVTPSWTISLSSTS